MKTTVTSTSDLTPAGPLGYAKSIAAFLAGLIAVIVQFVPADEGLTRWLTGAIAVLGFIAVYALPNATQPVEVDEPGRHAAPIPDGAESYPTGADD